MRRTAGAVLLALILGGGGFALGRRTVATVAPAQAAVRERAAGARVSCDEAAITVAVARALAADRAGRPEPAVAAQQEVARVETAAAAAPEPPSATQEAAAARSDELLERARASRRWSARDAEDLRGALREMAPDQRDRALRELAGALSSGELVAEVMPPL